MRALCTAVPSCCCASSRSRPLVIACTGHALAFGGILLFTVTTGSAPTASSDRPERDPDRAAAPALRSGAGRYRLSATGLEDVLFGRVVSPSARGARLPRRGRRLRRGGRSVHDLRSRARRPARPVVARTKLALRAPVVERITATLDETWRRSRRAKTGAALGRLTQADQEQGYCSRLGPSDFSVFFASSAGVAGALIGLLFVAISVAPAEPTPRSRSSSTSGRCRVLRLTDALTVSLFA